MVTFSIPKFLGIFLFIWLGFYGYIGITDPKGAVYSPFLEKYFDLIKWYVQLLGGTATLFLHGLGYPATQSDAYHVTIPPAGTVAIGFTCFGAGVMGFWLAFVWAHKAQFMYKLKWAAPGILLLFFINSLRIALIALALHLKWAPIATMDHHTVFNIICYLVIALLVIFFVRSYNRLDRAKTKDFQVYTPAIRQTQDQ